MITLEDLALEVRDMVHNRVGLPAIKDRLIKTIPELLWSAQLEREIQRYIERRQGLEPLCIKILDSVSKKNLTISHGSYAS